jgi:hypothetical protein
MPRTRASAPTHTRARSSALIPRELHSCRTLLLNSKATRSGITRGRLACGTVKGTQPQFAGSPTDAAKLRTIGSNSGMSPDWKPMFGSETCRIPNALFGSNEVQSVFSPNRTRLTLSEKIAWPGTKACSSGSKLVPAAQQASPAAAAAVLTASSARTRPSDSRQ